MLNFEQNYGFVLLLPTLVGIQPYLLKLAVEVRAKRAFALNQNSGIFCCCCCFCFHLLLSIQLVQYIAQL